MARAALHSRVPRPVPIAAWVYKFFRAIDVDVVTGEEYEPRPLSQKLRDRLNLPLDCVILLVLGEESFWTRDEIGIATAREVPIIPLVSSKAAFTGGVFGDQEFIPFDPDHIEQTFIGLLEAFRYIKLQRAEATT
jgi:hypothetical protein